MPAQRIPAFMRRPNFGDFNWFVDAVSARGDITSSFIDQWSG